MIVSGKSGDKLRTKTGYAQVKDGTLVLEGSVGGVFRNIWDGVTSTTNPVQAVAVSTIFLTVVVSLGMAALSSPPILGSALTVGLLAIVLASRKDAQRKNLTTASTIDTETIHQMRPESGIFGLIRPRLVIEFQDGDEIKSRYILLPHELFTDRDHLETAV